MGLISSAYNLISRFGTSGAATLLVNNSTYDKDTMSYSGTDTETSLYAYVDGFPSSRVNDTTVLASDRRILARIDSNFDGTVSKGDRIKVNDQTLSIIRSELFVVSGGRAYVEIQVRG